MNKKEFRNITEMLEENYNKQMDTRILELWYQEFKEYRDFSSMNNDSVPTNDEIVAAIRTLQKAGMSNMFSNQPLSMYNSNNENAMLNMLGDNTQNMNPQLIQALITNNMSLGF